MMNDNVIKVLCKKHKMKDGLTFSDEDAEMETSSDEIQIIYNESSRGKSSISMVIENRMTFVIDSEIAGKILELIAGKTS